MAKALSTSNPTIRHNLIEYGLYDPNFHPQKINIDLDIETVRHLHDVDLLAVPALSKQFGVPEGPLRKWMKRNGIKMRSPNESQLAIPPKEELEAHYNTKTLFDIAPIYGVSIVTIKKWFVKLGITLRTHSETQKIKSPPLAQNEFIAQCNLVHVNKYDYSNMDYYRAGDQKTKIEIICPIHGPFMMFPIRHIYGEYGCPNCNDSLVSYKELEVLDFVKSLGFPDANKSSDWSSTNKEIDIYVPSKQMGIEYNGIYWHSELYKSKSYHIDKTLLAKENGIKLLHIFESEWIAKPDIWKSIITNKLGKNQNNIMGRKCVIGDVPRAECNIFLENNHLQGNDNSKVRLGLYHDNKLVSVLTLCKSRFNKNIEWEISRSCVSMNTSINGAFNKLLSHFIKTYNPGSIISYVNLRYGTGEFYGKNGFTFSHRSAPNYFYIRKGQYELFSRQKFQKHKLSTVLENYDPRLSEKTNMFNNNYLRIYDCGNDAWIWRK